MTEENREHQEECCRRSFFASATDTAKRLVQDPSRAPDEVVKERMAICGQCSYYNHNKCDLCGCVMTIKSQWANMTCPHDPPKWVEFTKAAEESNGQ
jgi:hypothetical protein